MKKKLFTATILTVSAVALVVATVFVTVALLAATAGVTNTFTYGDVGIIMFEHKVGADGKIINPHEEVISNSYHLIPGSSYDKNPTIRITSTQEQDTMYLFVKTRNDIRTAEEGNYADKTQDTPKTMREQMEANGWVEFLRSEDGIYIVWVYGTRDPDSGEIMPADVKCTDKQRRGDGTEGPVGEFRLFETFTIHQNAKVDLYNAAIVDITAFAMQASSFDIVKDDSHEDLKALWEAIKQTFPGPCAIENPVNPYYVTSAPDAEIDAYEPVPNGELRPIGSVNNP